MRLLMIAIMVVLAGCKSERHEQAMKARTIEIAERVGVEWMMIGIKGTSSAASHGHAFDVRRFGTARKCAYAANAFQGDDLDHGARCIAVAPLVK